MGNWNFDDIENSLVSDAEKRITRAYQQPTPQMDDKMTGDGSQMTGDGSLAAHPREFVLPGTCPLSSLSSRD